MLSNLEFKILGLSKNLLRPASQDSMSTAEYTPRYTSNLIPARMAVLASDVDSETFAKNSDTSTSPSSGIRSYSEQEYGQAVSILRDIISAEQKFSDYEEAALSLALLTAQAANPEQIAGFFDMVRDIDPNRTRSFRKHLIQELQLYFPDRPIAKTITEALAKEWKESQRKTQGSAVSTRKVQESVGIDHLIQFNKSFFKWHNLFRALKRKREGSVDNSKFASLNKVKDAYFGHAMIYLLGGGDQAEHDFKGELGNTYHQFKTENRALLEVLNNPDSNPSDATRVLAFLRNVYFCLLVSESLCNYVNILKLEGPSAQALCPDKRKFVLGHLKRYQRAVLDAGLTDNPALLQMMDMNFTMQSLKDLVYNRIDCQVRIVDHFLDTKYSFHFTGKTDNITAIKVLRD